MLVVTFAAAAGIALNAQARGSGGAGQGGKRHDDEARTDGAQKSDKSGKHRKKHKQEKQTGESKDK
jgi:hypothetical protein